MYLLQYLLQYSTTSAQSPPAIIPSSSQRHSSLLPSRFYLFSPGPLSLLPPLLLFSNSLLFSSPQSPPEREREIRGMFQPEPTPFAAAYFPSSPFSYSPQTQTQSQSSSDAPPAGGPPPLDPTTFDFGYRIAVSGGGAGVGSGSGSAVPGAGVESAGRHHLGTPANCLATAAELKAARATASTTPSIRAGPPHPHQFHPDSHRTATASRNLPYGSFSATSPSSAASLSTSSPGNSALSTSPPSSCTAASPCSSYHSPTVSHQQHQLPLRNQPRAQQHGAHRHIHSRSPLIKMENQQQNPEQDQHGIAAQQAAAKDYQPDYEVCARPLPPSPSS